MRQKWRVVADDITSNKNREITFEDIAKFVEVNARTLTHLIFGKIKSRSKNKSFPDPKGPRSGYTFGTNGKTCSEGDTGKDVEKTDETGTKPYNSRCPMCNCNHLLSRCELVKKETVDNRQKLVRKRGLYDNCLFQCHIASRVQRKASVRYLVVKRSIQRSCTRNP